jgi:hypothetical protein
MPAVYKTDVCRREKKYLCPHFFTKLISFFPVLFFFLPSELAAQRKQDELRTKLYYEFESIPFFQETDSVIAYLTRDTRHYQLTAKKGEGTAVKEYEVYVNTDQRKRFLNNEPVFLYQKNADYRVRDSVQHFAFVASITRNYHKERFAQNDFQQFKIEFKKHFSRRKRPFIKQRSFEGYRQTIYFYCTKKDRLPYLELSFLANEKQKKYSVTLTVMR